MIRTINGFVEAYYVIKRDHGVELREVEVDNEVFLALEADAKAHDWLLYPNAKAHRQDFESMAIMGVIVRRKKV